MDEIWMTMGRRLIKGVMDWSDTTVHLTEQLFRWWSKIRMVQEMFQLDQEPSCLTADFPKNKTPEIPLEFFTPYIWE